MSHKSAIETTALQVYVSALLFSPRNSLIRKLFQYEEPDFIRIVPAMDDNWSACLQTLEGHSDWVRSVAFSHDSTRLASASFDNTVKIWDASSGACVHTLEGHSSRVTSVAFSHDSMRLASASFDSTVKIWDASSGACLQTLEGHSDSVKDLAGFENHHPFDQGIGISSDRTWITHNAQERVWLPSEYRPACSVVSGRYMGIGTGSGKVWMMWLKL
jgi:WD40 repeat protein